MRLLFLILFSSILLFQCKKEEKNVDAINIVGEYINNPVFGISDYVFINSDYFFPETRKKEFSVKSFLGRKEIAFHKRAQLEVLDFTKITFVKADFQYIKELKKTNTEFYTISKPIISDDKNYALLEVGRFNHVSPNIIGVPNMPDLIHVFLYKKVKGEWKRLELITQIRI